MPVRAYKPCIHLPISRKSIDESYCKQAFRLVDQRVPPPSRLVTSDFNRHRLCACGRTLPTYGCGTARALHPFSSHRSKTHIYVPIPPDGNIRLRHLQRLMQFYRIIGVVYLHTTDLSRDSSRIIISYYCLSKQQGHSAHISLGIHRAGGM